MMKSRMPCAAYIFITCQRIGFPPISTIGFGRDEVSSLMRVPRPPARMTHFMERMNYPLEEMKGSSNIPQNELLSSEQL
jgi:hypothetical protein